MALSSQGNLCGFRADFIMEEKKKIMPIVVVSLCAVLVAVAVVVVIALGMRRGMNDRAKAVETSVESSSEEESNVVADPTPRPLDEKEIVQDLIADSDVQDLLSDITVTEDGNYEMDLTDKVEIEDKEKELPEDNTLTDSEMEALVKSYANYLNQSFADKGYSVTARFESDGSVHLDGALTIGEKNVSVKDVVSFDNIRDCFAWLYNNNYVDMQGNLLLDIENLKK